ncbi:alkyl/aryl-sulfatase [Patescibacteria group bacterium]
MPKEATKFTKKSQHQCQHDKNLDWKNTEDEEFASRGFIAAEEDSTIKDVWSNKEYEEFEQGEAPDTVNPSLWRLAKLNNKRGLFKVTDKIYQVRGQSLSNMTIIEGETGYIIIDPNICVETARANLNLVYKHLGEKPVVAVCYSHSHIDHWGGVKGIVSEEDVKSGQTKIIASQKFLEYAISENLIAGNAMARRAQYMYGNIVPKGPRGQVDCALGKITETGRVSLLAPTDIISDEGKEMAVDGVKMIFQYASGEAPTGMHVYFPDHKTVHVADNCYHSLQNVYTIRGAYTRDAIDWRNSINRLREFPETEFLIGGHNWPIFGREKIEAYIKKQRDMLKYLHDQTLHLLNQGYTDIEIANKIELPPSLNREWYLRGYYGSLKHCVRGIYSRYMGWYDANPCNLDPLAPRETAAKLVEFMGGESEVISKAQQEFATGNYRFVCQILDQVIWANPANQEARELEADALEQLGYQTENATWRNAYLAAAQELREGVSEGKGITTASNDLLKATPIESFFDYLGVAIDGRKAFNKQITINWDFTDTKKQYFLTLENAVLNYEQGRSDEADVSLSLTRETLEKVLSKQAEFKDLIKSGEIDLSGKALKLKELFSLIKQFKPDFPIVTHGEK